AIPGGAPRPGLGTRVGIRSAERFGAYAEALAAGRVVGRPFAPATWKPIRRRIKVLTCPARYVTLMPVRTNFCAFEHDSDISTSMTWCRGRAPYSTPRRDDKETLT